MILGTAGPACRTSLQSNTAICLLQDGTIKYEIKLTGELSTNLPDPEEGASAPYGTMVLPGVNAQHHQHMFCARLDMAVDDAEGGRGLLVTEVGSCRAAMHLLGSCAVRNPTTAGCTEVGRRCCCTHVAAL